MSSSPRVNALCRQVTVVNRLGLHTRAATRLAQLASSFDAEIILHLDQQQANAASVLGVLMLQGCQGKEVKVCCQGQDAESALEAVCGLFASHFDEAN